MPAFAETFTDAELAQVVAFVRTLSGQQADAGQAEAGAVLFADNCASCHGDAGLGDQAIGAPNLADAIWLYGGDEASLAETIRNARFGVMPAWGLRLTEAEVRAAAIYVDSIGQTN